MEQLSLLNKITKKFNNTYFYMNGYLYRILYDNGTDEWLDSKGQLHRIDGPAFSHTSFHGDFYQYHYIHGEQQSKHVNGRIVSILGCAINEVKQ